MKSEDFQASIIQEIETRIKSFADDATVLEGYRSECEDVVTEYNGRQLFEMLQNMDDQMSKMPTNESKICQIEFSRAARKLVFKNVGEPFHDKGIKSIMYPHVSPKKKLGKTYIGNKGLGFRSLLNWHPSRIIIRSANLSFEFSNSTLFDVLDQRRDNIFAQQLKSIITSSPIPILTFPDVSPWNGSEDGWATEIELLIEESEEGDTAINSIENELGDFNPELLLFLPNLSQVEIKIWENGISKSTFYRASEWKESWSAILQGDNRVKERTISKYCGKEKIFSTDWIAFHDKGVLKNVPLDKDESPNFKLAIAVPRDPEKRKLFEHLYNYLPLRHVYIKLPCLVHATVKLDGTRDVLVIHEANRQIFTEILPRAFQAFTEMLKHKEIIDDPWLPYCMLTPPPPSGSKDYIEDLYTQLRKIRVEGGYCPCVDGTYRNVSECRYYEPSGDCDITEFFNKHKVLFPEYALSPVPEDFRENPCQDVSLAKVINENYLKAQLNDKESADLIFVLWNIVNRSDGFQHGLFKLFWNSDHTRLLDISERVYSPQGDDNGLELDSFSPPEFLPLSFVSKQQWNAVCDRFAPNERFNNENPKQYFCNNELSKICSVRYYNKSAVTIRMINECYRIVSGNERDITGKRQCISQLHRALLKGFNPESTRDPFRKEQIPMMIYDDGHIAYAHEFLFEEAKDYYNDKLPDTVFLSNNQIADFFKDKNDLLIGKSKEEYLRYIGVRSDVRIKYVKIYSENDPYISFLTGVSVDEGGLGTSGTFENNSSYLNDIPRLLEEDIEAIKTIPLENFLKLLTSGGINSFLGILKEHAPKIKWKPKRQGQRYAITYEDIAWNYVSYQLNGILDKLIFEESDRTLENAGLCFVDWKRQNISPEVLERLGAHASLSSLGAKQLYELMKSVAQSGIVPTKEFYKKINTALGECEGRGEKVVPPLDLKVYAKNIDGNGGNYYPVKDVSYHDNPSHARVLSRNCNMFYIGSRMGPDNIVRRFGVVKIDEGLVGDISYEKASSILQAEFDADWKAKETCIIALLRRHRDKRNRTAEDAEEALGQLHICLVSKLAYEYGKNKEIREVGLWEYLRDKKHPGSGLSSNVFYLNVGSANDLSDLNIGKLVSRTLCQSIAGILCDIVDLSDETLESQFRDCYYDIEKTRADLQEDEALNKDGELPPEPVKNRLTTHISKLVDQAKRVFACYLKPSIWLFLNEHKDFQRYFRDYDIAFRTYYEKALEEEGFFYKYCFEHKFETISNAQFADLVVEHIQNDDWTGDLPHIPVDWDHRDNLVNVNVPTASIFYPKIEKTIRDLDDKELFSLLFFDGNENTLKDRLETEKTSQPTPQNDANPCNVCELRQVKGCVAFGDSRSTSSTKKRVHTIKTGIGAAMSEKKYHQQCDKGEEAENKVLLWFKNQPGITKVEQKSSSGNEIDGNDSDHYDIEYYKGNDVFYVDVKSCESGVFHITAGEYEFAKAHPEQYQLALVISQTEFELIDNVVERIEQARQVSEWIVPIVAVKNN